MERIKNKGVSHRIIAILVTLVMMFGMIGVNTNAANRCVWDTGSLSFNRTERKTGESVKVVGEYEIWQKTYKNKKGKKVNSYYARVYKKSKTKKEWNILGIAFFGIKPDSSDYTTSSYKKASECRKYTINYIKTTQYPVKVRVYKGSKNKSYDENRKQYKKKKYERSWTKKP